jgi:hypothetical protein
MATCNCDGTISQDFSDYWGSLTSLTDVFGGVAPDRVQSIACENAVGIVKADGFDPCDPNYAEVLSNEYQIALGNVTVTPSQPSVSQVVGGTPYQNTVQRAVDTFFGQPSAPIAPSTNKPQPKPDNTMFLIAAIAILAVGFVLVFR